jgi:hypothetical protein
MTATIAVMSSGSRDCFFKLRGPVSIDWTHPAARVRTLNANQERIITMLYTIALVLVILWLLGLVTSYTMGGFIHVLLIIALVVVLLRVISGRTPL